MEWLESLILGVVQGVTEFLPISSDGHLSITQHAFAWLTGSSRTGKENLFFDVMLHLGTLAAILVFYRSAIKDGIRGFLGATDVPRGFERASIVHAGILAAVATSPLVPFALFLKDILENAFHSAAAAGYGFLVTAAVLLITSKLQKNDGPKGLAETTWRDALLIGIAQMVAPFPGVSRSGLTIATALALGFSRTWAVGFSLLIAIPAISGAVVFMLKDMLKSGVAETMTPDRIAQTVTAMIVAGVVGYAAILWLVKVVRSGRLWYFSVYLVLLALAVLVAVASKGSEKGTADASQAKQRTNPLERSAFRPDMGTSPVGEENGFFGSLDRPLRDRKGSDDSRVESSQGLDRHDFGRRLSTSMR